MGNRTSVKYDSQTTSVANVANRRIEKELNHPETESDDPVELKSSPTFVSAASTPGRNAPYILHSYKFKARLKSYPRSKLFIRTSIGPEYWISETSAEKDDCDMYWKHQRSSERLMHPDQDLNVELVTKRDGDFCVFARVLHKGTTRHPQLGSEFIASHDLYSPESGIENGVATDPIGSISFRYYFTTEINVKLAIDLQRSPGKVCLVPPIMPTAVVSDDEHHEDGLRDSAISELSGKMIYNDGVRTILCRHIEKLNKNGSIGPCTNQFLQQVVEALYKEKIVPKLFLSELEDVLVDVGELCSDSSDDLLESIYGTHTCYPVLLKSSAFMTKEFQFLQGDSISLTFALKNPDVTLRTTNAADFVRWTAALSACLIRPCRNAPRCCRVELSDEDFSDQGFPDGDPIPVILAGWLWRKKSKQTLPLASPWERRWFRLRAEPSTDFERPAVRLEWSHSESTRGSRSLELANASMLQPYSFCGIGKSPPTEFIIKINVFTIEGTLPSTNKQRIGTDRSWPFITFTDENVNEISTEHFDRYKKPTSKSGEQFTFSNTCCQNIPVSGVETICDGIRCLRSNECIHVSVMFSRMGQEKSCAGTVKLSLDSVPLNEDQGAIKLKLSEGSIGSSTDRSRFSSICISIEAIRLHPCVARWPCAWVPLESFALRAAEDDSASLDFQYHCTFCPGFIAVYRGQTHLWKNIPYGLVQDSQVTSASCLHIHVQARRSSSEDTEEVKAAEEKTRNSIIRAKKSGQSFQTWLATVDTDDDREENVKLRSRWEAYGERDAMTHYLTDEKYFEIDRSRIKSSSKSRSERGGVLLICPCSAVSLAQYVIDRTALSQDRIVLQKIRNLPDWAHFKADVESSEGRIGAAVDLVETLRAKQDLLSAKCTLGTNRPQQSINALLSMAIPRFQRSNSIFSDTFDASAAMMLRIQIYQLVLLDSGATPIWCRGSDMRESLSIQICRALGQSELYVSTVSESFVSSVHCRNSKGSSSQALFNKKMFSISDVRDTMRHLDNLRTVLDRNLLEVYLATPLHRCEYLRHASVLFTQIFLVAISEIGKYVASAASIRNISLEGLFVLMAFLLMRDECLNEILVKHHLKAKPNSLISAVFEPELILSRFVNRICFEIVKYAKKSVQPFEAQVTLKAWGPMSRTTEGHFFTECPEDMMAVNENYLSGASKYCRQHHMIVSKVVASILNSFMIHLTSLGKQLTILECAFRSTISKYGKSSEESGSPKWCNDFSVHYLTALINDIGRIINIHLEKLSTRHREIISRNGLEEGFVEVQDAYFFLGKRAAHLLAYLTVASLKLDDVWSSLFSAPWDIEIVHIPVIEIVATLKEVGNWIEEGPFFPQVIGATFDILCRIYLDKLSHFLESGKCSWGPEKCDFVKRDVNFMAITLGEDFPDFISSSFQELKEAVQILTIPIVTYESTLSATAVTLAGMIVTNHSTDLHSTAIYFARLLLSARSDVTTKLLEALLIQISSLVHAHWKSQPPKVQPVRYDLLSLIFEDFGRTSPRSLNSIPDEFLPPSSLGKHIRTRKTNAAVDRKLLSAEAENIVFGIVPGATSSFSLDVEVADLVPFACVLSLARTMFIVASAKTRTVSFHEVFSLYGPILTVAPVASGEEGRSLSIYLASLPLNKVLDDWYLLEGCGVWVHLRLCLRRKEPSD